MSVSHCIDWLQMSLKFENGDNPIDIINRGRPQHSITALTGEVGTNIKGYDTCLLMGAGRAHFHTQHPEHKISLQWSGQDLSAAAQEGLTAETMLKQVREAGAFVTRLDFAVDVKGQKARQLDILEAMDNGTAKTRASTWGAYVGRKKADGKIYTDGTVYIGSPAGVRMVRVYDKGSERGTREDWTRIELVSRKDAAHVLGLAVLSYGSGKAGRTALREFVQPGVAWFEQAILSETVYIQPVEKPIRDTVRWLKEDVMPILARVMAAETLTGKTELFDTVADILHRTKQLQDSKPESEGGQV